jgi:hypothetical protein
MVALDLAHIDEGAVQGSVTLWSPDWGFCIYAVLWGGRAPGRAEWMGLPGRQWVRDDGKPRYTRLFARSDDRIEQAFQQAALAAIPKTAAPRA